MHNTADIQAHVIKRVKLTESCSIVRISAQEELFQLIPGEVINVSTNPPGSMRRISSFSVLTVHSSSDFSLLVRSSGESGVSDSLTDKGHDTFWISSSFATNFKYPDISTKPILCLVAGSGISILGGLSALNMLKNTDILFFGREKDCNILPSKTIEYICNDLNMHPYPLYNLEVWNTTERGRPAKMTLILY